MNNVEDFRKHLIENNSDITAPSPLEQAKRCADALDQLSNMFIENMESTDCPGCLSANGIFVGETNVAYNIIVDVIAKLEEFPTGTCEL